MGSGTKHVKRQQSCQQEEKDVENYQKKKHKKRTKKVESQLKDQIEFYFSDSNLQKDRFLKQAISKNPEGYVSVKTIADFNRMKQLTNDIKLVIKAIKSSSLLQLNEDESMVRRTAPLPEARNVDAETVYVEKLPPHADHDWLRKVFSQFGKVTYVSLPRFKHTGGIKGFAFIEFETPNEAEIAVKTFLKEKEDGQNEEQLKPKRRKRSHSESDVDDRQSNKTERKRQRTISESSADSHDSASRIESLQLKKEQLVDLASSKSKPETTRQGVDKSKEDKGTRKRKRSDKAVHWEHGEVNQSNDNTACEIQEESEEKQPSKRVRSSESESNAEDNEELTEKKKKHKKRKRKAKEKKESKLPCLRVISKLEWLRLKQEYKQLQRQSMQELKKQLQECHERENDHSKEEKSPQAKKDKERTAIKETDKSAPQELPFTPGVVLHFKSTDTEIQKKDIRDKLAAHAPVAYIDLTDGTGEGYVRFHTPDNCTTVLDGLSSASSSGLELVKLTGKEERDYWKKINADRVARFQAKREKKRGTEKVARKADAFQAHQQVTHIRFDDE